jgi:hypothetical protein
MWTFILRGENRLRMVENEVLRRIFGSEKQVVIRKWGKLHYEEFYLCTN